jgi:uncharacterized protein (DUF1499 family)
MGLLRWLTRNWADTDEPKSGLEPLLLGQEPGRAFTQVQEAVRHLQRWQIEAVDEAKGTIQATRRTRWCGFVDDIAIRLEPDGVGTRIHVRSQSRFGWGDLGQNRRNVNELLEVLTLLNRLGELGGFK